MHHIAAFYYFFPIDNLNQIKTDLQEIALKTETLGLIILAPEGINATISNSEADQLQSFKNLVLNYFKIDVLKFKDSVSEIKPFRRLSIKIRGEIVTTGRNDLTLDKKLNHHLSPEQWDQMIENENPLIIDTRNWYEYKIGTFNNAVNPNTDKFTDFPQFMDSKIADKNQKIMIFCTGGIRCEKGILELQEKGYNQVYQLDGGILNYLKEKPNQKFQGECFVFDHRVAVDQNLNPSQQYKLCPHCGQPGKTQIICKKCETPEMICESCFKLDFRKDTCSKNCAHHYELNPLKKAKKQIRNY